MFKHARRMTLTLGLGLVAWGISSGASQALPGQRAEEVAAWIQGHPTLRPAPGETLLVRKSDTAAQRFIFQASMMPPGRSVTPGSAGIIRTEQISFFDMVNGVSRGRLEDSLRAIYGPDISEDYERAVVIYQYPNPQMLSQSRNQGAPLLASLQGELRQGDRYAYWLELAQTDTGLAYTGRINIFLNQDIEGLELELRNR